MRLGDLIEKARLCPMDAAQRRAQRVSFAFGNTAIGNPGITRELVDAVAEEMALSNRSVADD